MTVSLDFPAILMGVSSIFFCLRLPFTLNINPDFTLREIILENGDDGVFFVTAAMVTVVVIFNTSQHGSVSNKSRVVVEAGRGSESSVRS